MFIFSNLAISIDGKIATATREHFPLGTPEDRKQMILLRKKSDAILMGASTLRAYQKPLLVSKDEKQPLNVILSSNLEGLDSSWPFFTDERIQRLIFVSKEISKTRRSEFEKSSEIIKLSSTDPIALQIIEVLKKYSIQNLLVEGGGGVMWYFVEHDLIDEYHVTITPRVLGGSHAPTMVDGPGLSVDQVLNLKLKETRIVGSEIFLVYAKTGKRGRNLD
jgi:riboflavin-specific deaminase-like protein